MSALPEARDSLTYWESRLHTLPRRAVRQRREAREMAARWRDRVMQAELAEYGPGLIGTIFMLLAERRLPSRVQHSSRQAVRIGVGVALTVAASFMVLAIALIALLAVLIF
jgi:hypothetical protein